MAICEYQRLTIKVAIVGHFIVRTRVVRDSGQSVKRFVIENDGLDKIACVTFDLCAREKKKVIFFVTVFGHY